MGHVPKLPRSFPANYTGTWLGWRWVDGIAVGPAIHGVER